MKPRILFSLSLIIFSAACADGSLEPWQGGRVGVTGPDAPGTDAGLTNPDDIPDGGESGVDAEPGSDSGSDDDDANIGETDGGEAGQNCGALQMCGSECVDLANDDANCGQCGVTCSADEFCDAGTCFEGAAPEWDLSYGHNASGRPRGDIVDIATDDEGRLWVAGLGNDTVYQVAPESTDGAFVEAFDHDGTRRLRHVWPLFYENLVLIDNVAPIGGDAYVVTGRNRGTYTFDANNRTGPDDKGFVAELDGHGDVSWLTTLNIAAGRGVAVTDDVIYTHFLGEPNQHTMNVGDVSFSTEDGRGVDAFLIGLSRTGEISWGKGAGDRSSYGLALVDQDVVRMNAVVELNGPLSYTYRYGVDSFSSAGSPLGGYQETNMSAENSAGCIAAGGGAVYTSLFDSSSDRMVLQRYVSGELEWEIDLAPSVQVYSLGVDVRGRVYATGILSDPTTFDGTNFGDAGDGYVVAFDTDGSVRWSHFEKKTSPTYSVRIPEVEIGKTGLVYFVMKHSHENFDRIRALRQPW